MSYVRPLRKILETRNSELHGRLVNIEERAERLLTYTAGKFPYYTPHDFVTHSRNVEDNLNWIIDDNVKETLNAHEIFFLLVSAWLHDWGLIGKSDEDPKEIREVHNLRTEQYLEKLHDKVYLSLHEARIIGKICRGHTKEDLQSKDYDEIIFGVNIPIRVRFLTASLRIADECDITHNRTPEIIYFSLHPTDKAEEEFKKHLSITGVGRPETEKHKIQIFGIAWDPKGAKALEHVRDKIQKELDNVKLILAKHGIVLDYVELKIDTRGFINKPIEFVLDRRKVVELLIGQYLYSRKDCAIRELLQNSIDTCRLRRLLEKDYDPYIELCFSKERISIEDNGLGMSFEDASRYFSRKGASFYVSKEFEDLISGKKFDPISRFGIGILSCFLIGSKIIIETKKSGNSPCRFLIEDVAKGWRYEEGSRETVGTRITLILNEEGKKVDFEESLKHYAKKVTIPITVINEDSGEKRLLEQQWNCMMPEVTQNVLNRFDLREARSQEICEISSQLLLSETICTDGIEVTYFCLKPRSPLFLVSRNCFLSYHGIYVGNFDFFPARLGGNWFVLVNCTKDLIDIAISREALIDNEKNRNFVKLLYDNLLTFLETLTTEGKKVSAYDFDYCIKYATLAHRFLDDHSSENLATVEAEGILKFVLQKIYPILDSKGLSFCRGENIFSIGKVKKICQYLLPIEECEYHIESVSPFLKHSVKEGELLVFDIGPHFSLHDSKTGKTELALSLPCRDKNIEFEALDLLTLLRKLEMKKVNTSIDVLLPRKSSFVDFPQQFRSFVIQRTPYEFSISGKPTMNFALYQALLKKELFSDRPNIGKFYDQCLEEEEIEEKIKKLSDGEILFDVNDSFLKDMIEKSDTISSNDALKELVVTYLRYLSLFSSNIPLSKAELGYLISIERTIAIALGNEKGYKSLLERMGKMSQILLAYRHLPCETIWSGLYK